MFGLSGCAFRFGNVVGPRQTHGVGFDFARRLLDARARGDSPVVLKILGDGKQSKSYVHVSDIVRAVLAAHERTEKPFEAYNVATGDYITVTEIAQLAVECVGLSPAGVTFEYTGGDRGWKGDVPVVRLDTRRIRALGWRNERGSREALRASMLAMIPEMIAGRM
jgi:UDP-glucose 4-epimerase